MPSVFEVRIKSADSRLADDAVRLLVRVAKSMQATVQGPVPLPVVRGKMQPDESPAQVSLPRERTTLYKRTLRIVDPSEDAMLALTNAVLPLGVQSHICAA